MSPMMSHCGAAYHAVGSCGRWTPQPCSTSGTALEPNPRVVLPHPLQAMHLVYRALAKCAVPATLPPELVPAGKARGPMPDLLPTTDGLIKVTPGSHGASPHGKAGVARSHWTAKLPPLLPIAQALIGQISVEHGLFVF